MKFKYPREFKGIWIPAEIWLDKRLSFAEKHLFAEIDSLDGENGCYASNAYLSEFLGMPVATLKRALKKLSDIGYIRADGYRGRCRVWRSMLGYVYPAETSRIKMSQVPGSNRAKYKDQTEPPLIRTSNIKEKNLTEAVSQSKYLEKLKRQTADAQQNGFPVNMLVYGMEYLQAAPFGNYPKEWRCAKALVEKIKTASRGTENIIEVVKAFTHAYLRKKQESRQEFWTEAPLTPSAMCARFDQIFEYMRSSNESEQTTDKLRDMLEGMAV